MSKSSKQNGQKTPTDWRAERLQRKKKKASALKWLTNQKDTGKSVDLYALQQLFKKSE